MNEMKHIGILAALAAEANDVAARAALLSLRMLDQWFACGRAAIGPDSQLVNATREAVHSLPHEDPLRVSILQLINCIETLSRVDLPAILPRLIAIGESLIRAARLDLAVDVFETALDFGHPLADRDLYLDTAIRLGWCRRETGSLPEAEQIYRRVGDLAVRHRDRMRSLRSSIGLANTIRLRGDLPLADARLDEVVVAARRLGERELESLALMDQAIVAQQRGDPSRAICLSHTAYSRSPSERQREKLLSNIGAFLLILGRHAAARDALLLLEATATTEEARILARANLMSLAARTGDEAEFTRYAAAIATVAMSTVDRVNYLIESARGLRRFGMRAEASNRLRAAIDLAEAHGLNRSVFEAEAMLASGESAPDPRPTMPAEIPGELARIESELRARAVALAS